MHVLGTCRGRRGLRRVRWGTAAVLLLTASAIGLGAAPAQAQQSCQLLDRGAANGPCYAVHPSSGPVGTRIHFRVTVSPQAQQGWLADWRHHPSLRLFKRVPGTDTSRCLFIVPSQQAHWHLVRLEPYDPNAAVNDKAVVGWLRVGSIGHCSEGSHQRVTPGRYLLSTSWRHGAFARFRVLARQLPHTGATSVTIPMVLGGLLAVIGSGLMWFGIQPGRRLQS